MIALVFDQHRNIWSRQRQLNEYASMNSLRRLCQLLLALSGFWFPALALAELSLLCPCEVENTGQTAVTVTAGIRNTGDEVSGELRIMVGSSVEQPIVTAYSRAYAYFTETLLPGSEHEQGTEVTAGFKLPSARLLDAEGKTNLVLRLEEKVAGDWVLQDKVRLNPAVSFPDPQTGGESSNNSLYLEGTPTFEVNGGQATVTIPKIVNSGQEAITITRGVIGHFASEEFWGQTYLYGLNNETLSETIPGGGSLDDFTFSGDYDPPGNDYPFTSLSVRSEEGIEVWQTIEARNGNTIPTHSFYAESIDFLEDGDGDGVGDYNETLEGTDADNAESKPDTVILDVMALYTPGVAALYADDPITKVIQDLEWGNQSLSNSEIDASFRLVDAREVNYTETLDLGIGLDDVQEQQGVFEDIDALREAVGADLLVLYMEDDPDDNLCGMGTKPAMGREGDFVFTSRSQVVSVVAAECRMQTLTHEFGHNLGLAHDVREDSSVGTFFWSRGHGSDGNFTTIMAYNSDYSYYGPDIQYFSNPGIDCEGEPCGVDRSDLDLGADAALSIRTVMHQVARFSADALDSDEDGVIDANDAFPLDATESVDTDSDGIGDNADTDDDNDGVNDANDAFPLDDQESVDTDSDGTGDNADTDDDNDGVNDASDAFPLDATESVDTDSDGIGNNADTDDDNDGVTDSSDAFPLDATESVDTDSDGIGDNADTDDDGDGYGDDLELEYGTDPADAADWPGREIRSWWRFEEYRRINSIDGE